MRPSGYAIDCREPNIERTYQILSHIKHRFIIRVIAIQHRDNEQNDVKVSLCSIYIFSQIYKTTDYTHDEVKFLILERPTRETEKRG